MELNVPAAILVVFVGCCSNVVFLELLIKYDDGAGNIITFFQFLFIAVEGLILESKFFTKKPTIPVKYYVYMVMFFFTTSVVNNYALNFNVSLPLQMIFRAGSLMANMILGRLYFRRSYPILKYVSVVMITVGIAMATMASASQMSNNEISDGGGFGEDDDDLIVEVEGEEEMVENDISDVAWMSIGVGMLLFGLFTSAAMGIYQEVVYSKYGKPPKEAMFYTHAIPLPLFLLFLPDLHKRYHLFNASAPFTLGILPVPSMWLFLLMNGITQYVCIMGVFTLTTKCPSLVVTLVVTLRKFVSLIFSIIYFRNPFTIQHWVATALVFSGTIMFTEVLNKLWDKTDGKTKNKKID